MNNNQALTALIDHINASDTPPSLDWNETQQWCAGVIADLVAPGLLTKEVNAQTLECAGCENRCFMPIHLSDDAQRAFIVCDDPDKQNQIGRINVPLERLQQWQASTKKFAVLITRLLGMQTTPDYQQESARYKLGMLKGKAGRCWVFLNVQPLVIEINRHTIPVGDLLYFSGAELVIDKPRINDVLNSPVKDTGKPYTPDTNKREARKLATQAMYQDWYDEYLVLSKKHPQKTDTWYSIQIAKLPIAQGKSEETIRKNMKSVK